MTDLQEDNQRNPSIWADKYLQALADSGKLISRTVDNHKEIFNQVGMSAAYETMGNILSIQCEK